MLSIKLPFITQKVNVRSVTRTKLLMNTSGYLHKAERNQWAPKCIQIKFTFEAVLLLWREKQAHQNQRGKICAKHRTN